MIFYAVFLSSLSIHVTHTIEINVGVIIMDGQRLGSALWNSGAAALIGFERLKEMMSPKATVKLRFNITKDDFCYRREYAAIAAEMRYLANVDVFIGASCSLGLDIVGRMAASWNIPLLTPGGPFLSNFKDKTVFPTLTRLSFEYNAIVSLHVYIQQYFNWTDVTIMHDYDVYNTIIGETLQSAFVTAGLTCTLIRFDSRISDYNFHDLLQRASRTSRIFIYYAIPFMVTTKMMLAAHELGMTSGDYAFITYIHFAESTLSLASVEENEGMKRAFDALMIVSQTIKIEDASTKTFLDEYTNLSLTLYNHTYPPVDRTMQKASHDAFVIYGEILQEFIESGKDYRDGRLFVKSIWNRTFKAIDKHVINENGDRQIDVSLYDIEHGTGVLKQVAYSDFETKVFYMNLTNNVHWPNNKGPPVNKPRCGFTDEAPECKISEEFPTANVLGVVFLVVILIFGAIGLIMYRHYKNELDLKSNWWQISWEELSWKNQETSQSSDLINTGSRTLLDGDMFGPNIISATFKGSPVTLYALKVSQFHPTRFDLQELINLRDVHFRNITKFIGLTKHNSLFYAVNYESVRGTLRDILENDALSLNWDFRTSLICDVIEGVSYLHNSTICYHGDLNSYNCVIDSRFVLKVDQFGLQNIRKRVESAADNVISYLCLWMAPEVLRHDAGIDLQSADIYSFAIILSEILQRHLPFKDDFDHLSLNDIIAKLKNPCGLPFRPFNSVEEHFDADVVKLMKCCWEEDPKLRPNFEAIKKEAKRMKWTSSRDNFLDKILSRMEKYANDLESLVQDRTRVFLEEKQLSETLLYEVLPRSVAKDLMNGHVVEAQEFGCVTIYFSDIVGFTSISVQSSPMEVVQLLNDLYVCFDCVIDRYDVYKVETIGDAYMVASGLPLRNGYKHVTEISKMSLSILKQIGSFRIRHLPETSLRTRIGLHSGPVCAGVVGKKMPRYCLFGDTVNTASCMESSGEAMRVHVSEATRNLLLKCDYGFCLELRGEIDVRGKGKMCTYWLSSPIETIETFE